MRSAARLLLGEPEIVFDLETRGVGEGDARDPRSNEIVWYGLGSAARNYLIPVGHPKGAVITPAGTEKKDISTLYEPGDERALTPGGKISHRMVDVHRDAVVGALDLVENAAVDVAAGQRRQDCLLGLLQLLLLPHV